MSDHEIVIDLEWPSCPTLVCNAAPESFCHAVFDCQCEEYHDYGTADGRPFHDADTERLGELRHWGHFDSRECTLRDWLESVDGGVRGEVRIPVTHEWHGDHYTFTPEVTS